MSRCKIAQRLWEKVTEKGACGEEIEYEYGEYVHHIEEHGCWRYE